MIDRPAPGVVTIYTDGSCSPNPGPGGWAALLIYIPRSTGEAVERELSGHEPSTTNNRMEIMAAIAALEALKRPNQQVVIYTDSQLLQKGASVWLKGWRKNSYRRKNAELLNADLWRRLDEAMLPHRVTWRWVKAHNGHPYNDRVDQLACAATQVGEYPVK